MKADMSRDYYADLELPANADINEVKKQFRKLGICHHPCPQSNPSVLTYDVQLSNTTPTETPDERAKSTPNSRPSSPRTRFSQALSRRLSTMRTGVVLHPDTPPHLA